MIGKRIKESRLAIIMHSEMGFSGGSYFAMGEGINVPSGSKFTILDISRELDRSFVAHTTPDGRNYYGWANSSYFGG